MRMEGLKDPLTKQYMMSLHRGRFLVVDLYLAFSIDPQNPPLWANLYQKLPFFRDFGAVSPHFKSDNSEIWYEGAGL